MTAETLAAALLKDVLRFNVKVGEHTDPSVLLLETDVLAALSRAMSDDLAERVGEWQTRLAVSSVVDELHGDAADLITTLLTQNAALLAERDKYRDAFNTNCLVLRGTEERVERLEAALRELRHRWYLGDLQEKDFTAALKGTDHE